MKVSTVAAILTGLMIVSGWSGDRLQAQSNPSESSDATFEYEEERLDDLSEQINQDVGTPNTNDHTTPLDLPEEVDVVEDPVIIDTQSGEAVGVELWEFDQQPF